MHVSNPQKQVKTPLQTGRKHPHRSVAVVCVLTALGMVGLSYAAVPLYQMFCQATGLGGTPQKAQGPSDTILERTVTVRFDANVSPDMGWSFEPLQRTIDIKVGESALAFYRATNLTNHPVKGTATFNVAPDSAGLHFKKMECFCFQEQTLEPGQSVELPVSFFVDAALVQDPDTVRVKEIILSYTFYPVPMGEEPQKQVQREPLQEKKG